MNASLIFQSWSWKQGSTNILVNYENHFYDLAWRRWMVKGEIFPLDLLTDDKCIYLWELFTEFASDWIDWIFNQPSPSIKLHTCIDRCSLFKLCFNHFCQLQLDIPFIPALCFTEGAARDSDNAYLWKYMIAPFIPFDNECNAQNRFSNSYHMLL